MYMPTHKSNTFDGWCVNRISGWKLLFYKYVSPTLGIFGIEILPTAVYRIEYLSHIPNTKYQLLGLYAFNLILNVAWSFAFFGEHNVLGQGAESLQQLLTTVSIEDAHCSLGQGAESLQQLLTTVSIEDAHRSLGAFIILLALIVSGSMILCKSRRVLPQNTYERFTFICVSCWRL